MAAPGIAKQWKEFFEAGIHLPPAFDREHAAHTIPTPLCISLSNVDGVTAKSEEKKSIQYQLCVSLFDLAYRQFFGRQWLGPLMSSHGGGGQKKPRLKYNQNIYFHTSIQNTSVVCVVELVSLVVDGKGNQRRSSQGWGIVRPFKDGVDLPDSARNVQLNVQKVPLYYGTPRALFFMDEPIDANSILKPIPDCRLHYTICSHKAMLRVMNTLMPENIVFGDNDIIPGLVDRQDPMKDRMKRPKLLKAVPCQIDGLTIQLQPSVEKFEEELCELLQEDRTNRENRILTNTPISVVERRIKVGVHNGWCYVEKPETFYLDLVNEYTKSHMPMASPSFRRSKKFVQKRHSLERSGESSTLLLKSKIQLSALLEDPMFAIVFNLEYVIGEPLTEQDRKLSHSIARSHTRTVNLRWAAWNPFLQPDIPSVNVALVGGPIPSPDEAFMYRMPDTEMQGEMERKTAGGIVHFLWSHPGREGYTNGSMSLQVPALGMGPPMGSGMSTKSDDSEVMVHSGRKPPSGRQKPFPEEPMGYQTAQQMAAQARGMMPQVQAGMMYGAGQIMPQGYPPHLYMPMQQGPVGMYPMQVDQSHIGTTASDLQELSFIPAHAPIMAAPPQPRHGQGLTRAAYASLYSAGFPPVMDRNGEPPEVIDPRTPKTVNLQKEAMDSLQCNEIVFQFLAFSKMLSLSDVPLRAAGTVFFTFQFYRCPQVTTERLLLAKPESNISNDPDAMPFVLQRLDKDGSLIKGPPGLEVRYYMDPAMMKPHENQLFLRHLSQQILHIDVWDGDSLIIIGSASMELKYLCRGGLEAVQTTFELDVSTTEYHDEIHQVVGDVGFSGGVKPSSIFPSLQGKLHVRIANVGHPVDMRTVGVGHMSLPSKSLVVVSQTAGNSSFPGGSIANGFQTEGSILNQARVARAKNLRETNREVESLLFHKKEKDRQNEEITRGGNPEKNRKLARMMAVRQASALDEKAATVLNPRTEKAERGRDLKTMEIYRLQNKKDNILNMLNQSIATENVIYPSFGTVEFFEFMLRNPFNVQQSISIEYEDSELFVITDAREWRYYKQLNQLSTQVEESMFKPQPRSQHPEIFLRPKETVNVPFKYLSYLADHSVQPQGPVDPFRPHQQSEISSDALKSRVIKVFFKTEEGKPFAILQIRVEPQPHVIDRTFRFHHPEHTFLKKSIRLPPLHSLPGFTPVGGDRQQVFVRCSDPNVICESKAKQAGEPSDVFIKSALGASPQIKRFFLAVYTDPFLSHPLQIWQVFSHALQRVDVTGVEGQISRFSLLLRGTQTARLVRCFSSQPQEMQLHPNDQFMLAAGAVHEINVAIRPMKEGNKFFYLNVVDIEYHQLIRNWLICVSCRAPMVSRAFELKLPIGGGKGCNKKISYTNPYPHKKVFVLYCNREDLVQFKENRMEIEAGVSHTIGLRFTPVMKAGSAELLVFINDEEDKTEETFRITACYE
ncbi:hypothetical protein ScPMuIL_008886 [Solemya velum]